MSTKTYYVLDLDDGWEPEDFEKAHAPQPIKAMTAQLAAEIWGCSFGLEEAQRANILVADNPKGENAEAFRVECVVQATKITIEEAVGNE